MRGSIDAHRHAADNAKPGVGKRGGERFRRQFALRGGVAAADHRYSGDVQQLASPFYIQQRWRIGRLQQRLRVIAIGQRYNVIVIVREPGVHRREFAVKITVEDGVGKLAFDHRSQRGTTRAEDLFRPAETQQQFTKRFAAEARRQRQTQPRGEIGRK